jgi:hypothetical protein
MDDDLILLLNIQVFIKTIQPASNKIHLYLIGIFMYQLKSNLVESSLTSYLCSHLLIISLASGLAVGF